MNKQRVHMPKKEFLALKMQTNEITEQLILEVAGYKLYYMLNNAYNRTKRRNEYKDVEYKLGAYRDGMNNLKRKRPDLYEKYLGIVKTYLESGMKSDFSPTIHRTLQHYEWGTIDFLTNKEHKDLDNAKTTIIRHQFVLSKSEITPKKEAKLLTMEVVKKVAEGTPFPSITKALEFIQLEYGIKPSKIKKMIDSGEVIETEKGRFEIFRVENEKQVDQIKMDKFHEWSINKFPELHKAMSRFMENFNTQKGKKAFYLGIRITRLERKGIKLKKGGYKFMTGRYKKVKIKRSY